MRVFDVSGRFLREQRGYRWLAGIWLASVVILTVSDWVAALTALGAAAFAGLLIWFTLRLVKPPSPATEDVLRPSGTKLQMRWQSVVIGLVCVWALLYGWLFGSLRPGGRWMAIPHLTNFVRWCYRTRIPVHDSLGPYLTFATLVVLPWLLLWICGRTRRSLGVTAPANNVTLATLACIGLALVFAAIGLTTGKITVAGLGFLLLHNFFSNGFSEEFFARGMVMSQLRGYLPDDWALVGQALMFSAFHFGSTMPEPAVHGNVVYALANNVALNAPIGLALGVMALRGKSLLQGTILHMFLDTMARTI